MISAILMLLGAFVVLAVFALLIAASTWAITLFASRYSKTLSHQSAPTAHASHA